MIFAGVGAEQADAAAREGTGEVPHPRFAVVVTSAVPLDRATR
jgi:hypothetical protein